VSNRRFAVTALLVALSLAALPGAAAAQGSSEVRVPGSFKTETQLSPDGSRCNAYLTYVWGHIPGAISYRVQATDTITGSYDDTVEPGFDAGLADGLPPVGKNMQRTRMNASFGPAPCPGDLNGGRWTVKVTANFCEEPFRRDAAARQGDACESQIVGTVLNSDSSPAGGVPISIKGPMSKTARTNSGGGYGEKVKPGNYDVSAPTGYCVAEGGGCKKSKTVKVKNGQVASVNFVAKDLFFVEGTITDEFERGLDGVTVRLTGPESESDITGPDGKYKVEVDEPGTYEITATGENRGPYELYYIRLADGQSSGGQAADVPFGGTADSSYELDWIQHDDPAPDVGMSLDFAQQSGGHPLSVVCDGGDALAPRPLWPTLDSAGNYQALGLPFGPETTTDETGTIPLELFPGTEGGSLTFSGNRRDDVTSFFFTEIPFSPPSGGVTEDQLREGLRQWSPQGNFASLQALIDLVATSRGGVGDQLAGTDAVPVRAGAKAGVAFFPLGSPPGNPASGDVQSIENAWVWDDGLLQALPGIPDLPSLSEWSEGQPIRAIRDDNRTFLGYPLHTSVDGSVGDCLAGEAGATMTFAAHSPAHILLTDAQGRKVGFDAKGKAFDDAGGARNRIDGDDYVIVPNGNYKLTVAGTGGGPVTLEARSGGTTRIAQFDSAKGEKVTFNVSGANPLPKQFSFNGEKVRTASGIPLEVKGFPRKLRAGKRTNVNLTIKDALGDPVTSPTLTYSGAAEGTAFGDANGKIRTSVTPTKSGKVTFEVSGIGRLEAKRSVKVSKK
jgi:hypothetical protein